jgi:hypothetical protein
MQSGRRNRRVCSTFNREFNREFPAALMFAILSEAEGADCDVALAKT